ncbi:MAG: F0F1 ATP synthase subunit A [Ghiorsea sp.]
MNADFNLEPLQHFQVINYVDLSLFGLDISISNSVVWMWVAVVVTFIGFRLAVQSCTVIPNRLQLLAEIAYQFIATMLYDIVGTKGKRFIPIIFTLFFFVLACNLLGLIPGSFTPTSQLVVTSTLAIGIFIFTIILRVFKDGFGFFRAFSPSGLPKLLLPLMIPIEILSFLARPVSLALRLFANMTAGHTVLTVIAFFGVALPWFTAWLPLGFSVVLYTIEIFIAFIQAYIFAILSCVYIDDALIDH